MSIEEAAEAVGRLVIYRPKHGPVELGVITSVNSRYVFVRYGANPGSEATSPEDLEFISVGAA